MGSEIHTEVRMFVQGRQESVVAMVRIDNYIGYSVEKTGVRESQAKRLQRHDGQRWWLRAKCREVCEGEGEKLMQRKLIEWSVWHEA